MKRIEFFCLQTCATEDGLQKFNVGLGYSQIPIDGFSAEILENIQDYFSVISYDSEDEND